MVSCEEAFDNLCTHTHVSKIVKEDILRILCEKNRKTSIEILEGEIKVTHSIISEALETLERNGLIAIQENLISLTELGQENAKDISDKHFMLEDYLEKIGNGIRAHTAAHILEHYVSGEVINNIKKLSTLKKEGIPLTELELNKEGIITDITLMDHGLFERLVSMGVFLGEKVKVVNKIPDGVIAKIKHKKFALDKNIAREIKAVEYEQS